MILENNKIQNNDSAQSGQRKGTNNMEEKINIEFTGEEFDKIMQYMNIVEATTVQNAIMNAISIALDESDS